MNQAEDLEKRKEYDRAIPILQQARAIAPENVEVLRQYGKILAKRKRYEEAFEVFEQALKIEPENVDALRNYGTALADRGMYDRAFVIFDNALEIEPENVKNLSSYRKYLLRARKFEESFAISEKLLKLEPNNVITLTSFANELTSAKRYDRAFELFERALQVEQNNAITITSYGNALASAGRYDQAFEMFERGLQVEPNNVETLANYVRALISGKQYDKGFEIFKHSLSEPKNTKSITRYANSLALAGRYEQALKICEGVLEFSPTNAIALKRYANVLALAGRYKQAFKKFEQALHIEIESDNDIARAITMSSYGSALAKFEKLEKAIEMHKQAVLLAPENTFVLGSYGLLLVNIREWEEACTVFRQVLQMKQNDKISYQYARALEELGKYSEAISQLKAIAVDQITQAHASVIRASIGRLYYLIKQPDKGNEYFNKAIANSDDKEKTLLYSATSILASDPYSETAVEMLRGITEESSWYDQAREMLTLNLSEEDYFEMVKADAQSGLNDTEMINRAMYHKIANEIGILKGIAYRIKRLTKSEDKSLNGIIQYIEDLFEKVNERRAEQQSQIENIPENDYQRILAVISQTAHDISDFVNNELPVIESKIRRAMRKLQPDKASHAQFEKLLVQLELTQAALDDLKAINQGIEIRNSHFPVQKLFEKWEVTPQIEHANIFLYIKNCNSEFYGDEEKIKSILNELVGNSLKHNRKQNNLRMQITSQDAINPQGIRAMTIPGEQKYLFIKFTDNGKGIPEDKKDWIFQPLKTTSSDKGSGLGLFIIRKTLTKMKGYIRETGQKGARFEIYIPYRKEEI